MANFDYTNRFQSGTTPSADDLNQNFDDVRDFLLTTKLDTNNLTTKFCNQVFSVVVPEVVVGTPELRRLRLPSGVRAQWVEVQLAFESGVGATAALDIEEKVGTTLEGVLTATLTNAVAGTVATTAGFDIASTGGTTELVITLTATGANADDVTVTVWFKSLLRS